MKLALTLHVLCVVVTTSYVTLGVFAPSVAGPLWWPYALVTFFLATASLQADARARALARRRHRRTVASPGP